MRSGRACSRFIVVSILAVLNLDVAVLLYAEGRITTCRNLQRPVCKPASLSAACVWDLGGQSAGFESQRFCAVCRVSRSRGLRLQVWDQDCSFQCGFACGLLGQDTSLRSLFPGVRSVLLELLLRASTLPCSGHMLSRTFVDLSVSASPLAVL